MKKVADLRVCASCEYIFQAKLYRTGTACPVCGYASYGARAVYGKKAYSYLKSQKPFYDKEMAKAQHEAQNKHQRAEEARRQYAMDSLNIHSSVNKTTGISSIDASSITQAVLNLKPSKQLFVPADPTSFIAQNACVNYGSQKTLLNPSSESDKADKGE